MIATGTSLKTALGLMSGTSLDGVDAAAIRTDGEGTVEFGPSLALPYEEEFRERLRRGLGRIDEARRVERELTEIHARCVLALMRRGGLSREDIDVVGFHGQTILHRPREGQTVQIGDGSLLARLTGIDVVGDFRSRDVANGGEGAPLAPLYHAALCQNLPRPAAVLNLGGVANVTWMGRGGEIVAFDTGPGNALLDDWIRTRTGCAFDVGGRIAAAGRVVEEILCRLLAHPYFERRPPKSLDRNDFDLAPAHGLSTEDGAATLVAFTASGVARGLRWLPAPPVRWLVAGGGRHNRALMAALSSSLGAPVDPVETVGWDGDALEAQAFAYLAVRSLAGLPLSLPSTTGVRKPVGGGTLHLAPQAGEARKGTPR